jgi:glycosyltransferase involved in cell wall biosynthesis
VLFLLLHQNKNSEVILHPVSVVVCSRNEYESLQELLPALLQQDYPDFEVIIVDDRSWDGSYDYLLGLKSQYSHFRLVRIEETPDWVSSKKYALTLGLKAAKHRLVLLTDADCVPVSNQWIKEMVQNIGPNTEAVLGYSPYQVKKGLLNLLIRYETFYTGLQYLSFAAIGKPYMGVGRNLCYFKDMFLKNKNLHLQVRILGGDDDIFINTIAKKDNIAIALKPETQVISKPKETFKEWYLQKKRHLSVGKHYKMNHKFILALLAVAHFGARVSIFVLILAAIFGYGLTVWQEPLFLGLLSGSIFCYLSTIVNYSLVSHKLKDSIKWYQIIWLDWLYLAYYFVFTIPALMTKNVKWK